MARKISDYKDAVKSIPQTPRNLVTGKKEHGTPKPNFGGKLKPGKVRKMK